MNGADGKKLSKRHGAVTVDEFRAAGYYPDALVNFLALLGWAPDGETTIMSRDELVERFTLERVGASPATFDYDKLDWMNGVYLRELSPDAYADALIAYLRDQGSDWDEARIRAAAPLVQEKIAKLGEFPEFAGFLFHDVEPDPALLDRATLSAAAEALAAGRAVHRRADRDRAEGALRAPRAEAAAGLSADPRRRYGFEGLARALREPGAARPRRVAGATQSRRRRQPLDRRERVERSLELEPRTAAVARRGCWNPDLPVP